MDLFYTSCLQSTQHGKTRGSRGPNSHQCPTSFAFTFIMCFPYFLETTLTYRTLVLRSTVTSSKKKKKNPNVPKPSRSFCRFHAFPAREEQGSCCWHCPEEPPRTSPSQEAGRWGGKSCYYQYRHSYWQHNSNGFCSLSLDRRLRVKYRVYALKEEVIPELEHKTWKFSGLKTSQSLLNPLPPKQAERRFYFVCFLNINTGDVILQGAASVSVERLYHSQH